LFYFRKNRELHLHERNELTLVKEEIKMAQNILANESTSIDSSRTRVNSSNHSSSNSRGNTSIDSSSSSNNSKLLKGIVIGGMIGGFIAMLDSDTRNKVKDTALTVKDSSMNLVSEVKKNPSDVKEQMIDSIKEASQVMKEAINNAQDLYKRLNTDLIGNVSEVKDITNQTINTAKEAKGEIADIGTKVKEAGSTVMDNPVVDAATGSGTVQSK
jgi:gas vesicle protein